MWRSVEELYIRNRIVLYLNQLTFLLENELDANSDRLISSYILPSYIYDRIVIVFIGRSTSLGKKLTM